MKVSTRNVRHQVCLRKKILGKFSGSITCTKLSRQTKTVKVEYNRFNRKVREALEIQLNKCGPSEGGMNLDNGQYVDTKFWTTFFDSVREKRILNDDDRKTT